MNQLVLPVTPATLPSGSCPATNQDLLDLFAQYMSVTFPDTFDGVIVSATKPTDTTRAWLQLDSLGRPVRFYYFAAGAWLSQHPCVPGFTMIWTGPLPTLTAFDGGDATGVVSPITGQMWELVTDLAAKFPVGAGTLPSATVLAPNDTGGEEKHVLTIPELPKQSLYPDPFAGTQFPSGGGAISGGGLDNSQIKPFPTLTVVGNDVGHNTMPPYFTVNFLRRTARLFYSA